MSDGDYLFHKRAHSHCVQFLLMPQEKSLQCLHHIAHIPVTFWRITITRCLFHAGCIWWMLKFFSFFLSSRSAQEYLILNHRHNGTPQCFFNSQGKQKAKCFVHLSQLPCLWNSRTHFLTHSNDS